MKCRICEICEGKTVTATYKAVDSTFKKLTPYLCTEHANEVTEHNPLLFFEKIRVESVETEKVKVAAEVGK